MARGRGSGWRDAVLLKTTGQTERMSTGAVPANGREAACWPPEADGRQCAGAVRREAEREGREGFSGAGVVGPNSQRDADGTRRLATALSAHGYGSSARLVVFVVVIFLNFACAFLQISWLPLCLSVAWLASTRYDAPTIRLHYSHGSAATARIFLVQA